MSGFRQWMLDEYIYDKIKYAHLVLRWSSIVIRRRRLWACDVAQKLWLMNLISSCTCMISRHLLVPLLLCNNIVNARTITYR